MASYITQEELEAFEKKFVKEGDEKPQEYCNAAMEMIEKYLGYNPEMQTYTTLIKGDGGALAALKSYPITEITGLKINGEDHEAEKLEVENDNYVCFLDGSCFVKGNRYEITYNAGFSTVPYIIKQTALQIASLFWESAGGNLAVSSQSFADTGSRVFNNFKADRFLEQIAEYKRVF